MLIFTLKLTLTLAGEITFNLPDSWMDTDARRMAYGSQPTRLPFQSLCLQGSRHSIKIRHVSSNHKHTPIISFIHEHSLTKRLYPWQKLFMRQSTSLHSHTHTPLQVRRAGAWKYITIITRFILCLH